METETSIHIPRIRILKQNVKTNNTIKKLKNEELQCNMTAIVIMLLSMEALKLAIS
jgi:hypothetical protein